MLRDGNFGKAVLVIDVIGRHYQFWAASRTWENNSLPPLQARVAGRPHDKDREKQGVVYLLNNPGRKIREKAYS